MIHPAIRHYFLVLAIAILGVWGVASVSSALINVCPPGNSCSGLFPGDSCGVEHVCTATTQPYTCTCSPKMPAVPVSGLLALAGSLVLAGAWAFSRRMRSHGADA